MRTLLNTLRAALCALLLSTGCAANHQIDDGGGFNGGGGPGLPRPDGSYMATPTGSFDVLPASGDGNYTLIFRDRSRPKLSLRTPGDLTFTAIGSQLNAAARERLEYSLRGSFTAMSLSGNLTIVHKRSDSGVVFSTENVQLRALKQRHDTF